MNKYAIGSLMIEACNRHQPHLILSHIITSRHTDAWTHGKKMNRQSYKKVYLSNFFQAEHFWADVIMYHLKMLHCTKRGQWFSVTGKYCASVTYVTCCTIYGYDREVRANGTLPTLIPLWACWQTTTALTPRLHRDPLGGSQTPEMHSPQRPHMRLWIKHIIVSSSISMNMVELTRCLCNLYLTSI